jgi:hypothetical protein
MLADVIVGVTEVTEGNAASEYDTVAGDEF